jgi:hypothetical protein
VPDHDQRFKNLLHEFFESFVRLVVPDWADRFDYGSVEWLEQELFTDPPQGKKGEVDLVARVRLRQPATSEQEEEPTPWLCLLHVEIEARDRVQTLRQRVYDYWRTLHMRHGLPVLSLALYLKVGLEGLGWDVYEEYFFEHRILRFEYPYLGLPALDSDAYLHGPNLLGSALSVLMRVPEEQLPRLKADAVARVATSGENEYKKFLLLDCIEAYRQLEGDQLREYEQLLQADPYVEARMAMVTTYEKGVAKGIELGQRVLVEQLLIRRFNGLSEIARQRLAARTQAQLSELAINLLNASSLKELGLED